MVASRPEFLGPYAALATRKGTTGCGRGNCTIACLGVSTSELIWRWCGPDTSNYGFMSCNRHKRFVSPSWIFPLRSRRFSARFTRICFIWVTEAGPRRALRSQRLGVWWLGDKDTGRRARIFAPALRLVSALWLCVGQVTLWMSARRP